MAKPDYLFVTGAYRSGTTLLHRLLDGHSKLLSFPVENCLYRDIHYFQEFPRPHLRRQDWLLNAIEDKSTSELVGLFYKDEKLGLPLAKDIDLKGSTGNQVVETGFNRTVFESSFKEVFESRDSGQSPTKALYRAYMMSYFRALGISNENTYEYFVNKCPEKGRCIPTYFEEFPDSKIIHIIRDPRAVIASHKGGLGVGGYWPYERFDLHVQIVSDALENYLKYRDHRQVLCLRYEDLLQNPEALMKRVCEFLAVDMEAILLEPTILGGSWKANSSSSMEKRDSGKIFKNNPLGYQKKLSRIETGIIESRCHQNMQACGYDLESEVEDLSFLRGKYKRKANFSPTNFYLRLQNKFNHLASNS